MNNAGRDQEILQETSTAASISSARREEARQERGLDPRVLQRLLEDPNTPLRDD